MEIKTNTYQLKDFNQDVPSQQVSFYEMYPNGNVENGTTIEEMLRVSIARLTDLNSRFSCRENSIAITKMQEALMWLNERTRERKERGVEGKHIYIMKKRCKEMHKRLAEMCNETYPPGKPPYLGYSYSCPICNTVWHSDMKYIYEMDARKDNAKKTIEAIFSNKIGIEMQREVLKRLLKHLPK